MMANPVRLSPQDMDKLSQLAFMVAHNEKTRDLFAHLVKHVSPGDAAAFQDVFVKQQFAQLRKEIQDDRLKEKMEAAKQARDNQRLNMQRARGFSDAQMQDVAKIQERYGFADWEAAADIYAQRNPPENPALKPPPNVTSMGTTWELPSIAGRDGKEVDFKDFVKNPRKFSNDLATVMIHDFMGKRPTAAPAFAR